MRFLRPLRYILVTCWLYYITLAVISQIKPTQNPLSYALIAFTNYRNSQLR